MTTLTPAYDKLYPVQMTKAQYNRFLSNYAKGKFGKATLEEAWLLHSTRHINYWRDRYGLDDAKPFRMISGSPIGYIVWVQYGQQYCLEFKLKNSRPTFIHRFQGNLPEFLAKLSTSWQFVMPIVHTQVGVMYLFTEARPEHDWALWQNTICHLVLDSGRSFKKKRASSIVKAYKQGNLSDIESIEALRLYILRMCT